VRASGGAQGPDNTGILVALIFQTARGVVEGFPVSARGPVPARGDLMAWCTVLATTMARHVNLFTADGFTPHAQAVGEVYMGLVTQLLGAAGGLVPRATTAGGGSASKRPKPSHHHAFDTEKRRAIRHLVCASALAIATDFAKRTSLPADKKESAARGMLTGRSGPFGQKTVLPAAASALERCLDCSDADVAAQADRVAFFKATRLEASQQAGSAGRPGCVL